MKASTGPKRTRISFLHWSLSIIVLLFGPVVVAKDYAIWEIDKIRLQADMAYDEEKFDDAVRYFQELSNISSGLDAALHQKYISALITTSRVNLAENELMNFEKLYAGNHIPNIARDLQRQLTQKKREVKELEESQQNQIADFNARKATWKEKAPTIFNKLKKQIDGTRQVVNDVVRTQQDSEINECSIAITESFSDGMSKTRILNLDQVVSLDVQSVHADEANLMGLLNPLTYVEALLSIFDSDTGYHYMLISFKFRDGSEYKPRLIVRTRGDAGFLIEELLELCYVPKNIWIRGLDE